MGAERADGGEITAKWQTQMKRVPRSGRQSLSMALALPQVNSSCQCFPLAVLLSQALLSSYINLSALTFILSLRAMLPVFCSISVQLFFSRILSSSPSFSPWDASFLRFAIHVYQQHHGSGSFTFALRPFRHFLWFFIESPNSLFCHYNGFFLFGLSSPLHL